MFIIRILLIVCCIIMYVFGALYCLYILAVHGPDAVAEVRGKFASRKASQTV